MLGTRFRERIQCPVAVAVARVHVAHGGASAMCQLSDENAQVLRSPEYDRDEALCPQI